MGLYEDMLARATPGGFPAIAAPPIDPIEEQAAAQAAREAAALRLSRGVKRDTPLPEGSLLPFGALGAGMLAPSVAPDQPAAPDFGGPVPVPRDRPKEADGAPMEPPTDLSGATVANPYRVPQLDNVGPRAPVSPPPATEPMAPSEAPTTFGSLASGLMSGLKNNSATLLALGAGFAGAPNIGQGISRAASAAIPAQQFDIKNRMTLESQKQTLQALIAKGVPVHDALAAISNPDVMKATVSKYFETKPLQHVMAKGPLGEDIPMVFDQNKGMFLGADGKPLNQDGSGGGALGTSGVYAPGVTKIDPNLNGDEMLAQYHPDVQAAAKAYMNGDVMPSGNPRQKTIADLAKRVAIRYGQDMGIPVSDASYQEKLTHRREMASGKAGVGLQRTALRQGLEHLEGATKQAIDLGNYGLGLAPLTEGVNAVRGLTDAQKGKVNAFDNKIQTLAGEVGKFFSSASGGGVHEREATRSRFKGITAPSVLADAIDSTLELMEGGLHSREQSQQQLFGGNVPTNVQYLTKDDRDRIDHIRALSSQLRKGSAPAAAPAATPSGKTSTGVQWSIVQ